MDHLNGFRDELTRFRGAIGPLDARVPSCPDWTVGHLVQHVGTVHRTFHRVAREGWMQRPPAARRDDRPAPDDPAVVTWAHEEGDLLVAALTDLDPMAPRWNFSHGPQVGAFIPRRMHHETTIHRWDLEGAYGAPGTIAADVAMDGIDEYLAVYVPRRGIWSNPSATVHLEVDEGRTFALHLPAGELPRLDERATSTPDLVLAGAAEPVLLALWDRAPLATLRRSGDRSVLEGLRAHAYT